MFTGIVETTGIVASIEISGTNRSFWITSSLSNQFKIDQSVSHNGVCLTVEAIDNNQHKVTAIEETLRKTTLGNWVVGSEINIEQCMPMNGRLDGHIVQGHVDTTAVCIGVATLAGSWEFVFSYDSNFAHLLIEKGSISVNGTSLTCFNITNNTFTVAIIPYTFENTSIKQLKEGDTVNLEFDMIGKYIHRIYSLQGK